MSWSGCSATQALVGRCRPILNKNICAAQESWNWCARASMIRCVPLIRRCARSGTIATMCLICGWRDFWCPLPVWRQAIAQKGYDLFRGRVRALGFRPQIPLCQYDFDQISYGLGFARGCDAANGHRFPPTPPKTRGINATPFLGFVQKDDKAPCGLHREKPAIHAFDIVDMEQHA